MIGYLKALSVGLLVFSSVALNALPKDFKNSCVPLSKFSQSQKDVLTKAFLAGYKSGFGYTLAAIAWQESCAGEYKMNFQDPSAGIYHAHLPGVIKKFPRLKQNGFTENMVGAFLVNNDEFATKLALDELNFWKGVHKGDWEKVVKSYNKGYRWQNEKRAKVQAEYYYRNINEKVALLKQFFNNANYKSLVQKASLQESPTYSAIFKKIEQNLPLQEDLVQKSGKEFTNTRKLDLPIYNMKVQFDYVGFASLENNSTTAEQPQQIQWYQRGNDIVRSGEEKPIRIDYSKEAQKLLEAMDKSIGSFNFKDYMQLYSIALEQHKSSSDIHLSKKGIFYDKSEDPFDYGIPMQVATNSIKDKKDKVEQKNPIKLSLPFYAKQKKVAPLRLASAR